MLYGAHAVKWFSGLRTLTNESGMPAFEYHRAIWEGDNEW